MKRRTLLLGTLASVLLGRGTFVPLLPDGGDGWHMWVVTSDGSKVTVYRDGVLWRYDLPRFVTDFFEGYRSLCSREHSAVSAWLKKAGRWANLTVGRPR